MNRVSRLCWFKTEAQEYQIRINYKKSDPLELVRYAEGECQAWYNTRDTIPNLPNVQTNEETQALSLNNICIVDCSWTSTGKFSGI